MTTCFAGPVIRRKAYCTMKLTKELRFWNSGFSTNTRIRIGPRSRDLLLDLIGLGQVGVFIEPGSCYDFDFINWLGYTKGVSLNLWSWTIKEEKRKLYVIHTPRLMKKSGFVYPRFENTDWIHWNKFLFSCPEGSPWSCGNDSISMEQSTGHPHALIRKWIQKCIGLYGLEP